MKITRAYFSCAAAMLSAGGALIMPFAAARSAGAQNNANPLTTWTVTIVLPPRLMAGHPATLAVLGVDGKIAPGVTVELGNGQSVTTDRTGRAVFNVPTDGGYLLAKGSGAEAAALIDPARGGSEPNAASLPPVVSIHDRFWICGAGLQGRADEDGVYINGQAAAVLAASPICLVALAGANAQPGPAEVAAEAPGVEVKAKTTLVALEFAPPNPPLKPGERSDLSIHARGSSDKLTIVAENRTPRVLRFVGGDTQELVTHGGDENTATVKVQAIASGDFSFNARLLPSADIATAERYLRAAVPLAPKNVQRKVSDLDRKAAQNHAREIPLLRAEVQRLAASTIPGDFRTLLEAAEAAL